MCTQCTNKWLYTTLSHCAPPHRYRLTLQAIDGSRDTLHWSMLYPVLGLATLVNADHICWFDGDNSVIREAHETWNATAICPFIPRLIAGISRAIWPIASATYVGAYSRRDAIQRSRLWCEVSHNRRVSLMSLDEWDLVADSRRWCTSVGSLANSRSSRCWCCR